MKSLHRSWSWLSGRVATTMALLFAAGHLALPAAAANESAEVETRADKPETGNPAAAIDSVRQREISDRLLRDLQQTLKRSDVALAAVDAPQPATVKDTLRRAAQLDAKKAPPEPLKAKKTAPPEPLKAKKTAPPDPLKAKKTLPPDPLKAKKTLPPDPLKAKKTAPPDPLKAKPQASDSIHTAPKPDRPRFGIPGFGGGGLRGR